MRMSRFHETLVQRSPRNDSVALTNEKLHRTFENNSSLKDSLCLTCDIFSCVRSSRSLWDFYFYEFFIQSSCCFLSLSWVSLILVLISSVSAILRAQRAKILHQNVGAQNPWSCYLCISLTSVPEDGPQLSAQAGLHQHVDILPVLERLVQPEITEIE